MSEERGWWKAWAEITALAITFPLTIAAGYGLGWWLDRELGTSPWLTIVFAALGVVGAFTYLFRLAARNERTDRRD
ncbi:MAG: AtpZ/AtpI family protein [Thermoanaerobaculia bacterium]